MSWLYRWRCVGVLALQLAVVLLALAGLDLAGLGIEDDLEVHHRGAGVVAGVPRGVHVHRAVLLVQR